MSEVPLGCFLSGGLDSTAIVQAMRRHVTGDLRTFSIGFEEDDHNELPFARQVARKFNTIHEEFIVRPDALAALGALAWHYDEPMADSSAIPSYYLAQMTRRHVTVALNGDGGDESYAGYRRYDGYASWNKINSLPEPIRKVALAFTRPLSAMLPVHSRMRYLAYLLDNSFQTVERQYAQTLLMFPDYHKRALLDPDLYEVLDGPEGDSPGLIEAVMMSGAAKADIDKKMFGDIKTYLPGALLTKIDRATMAHSIEGRSPFLDQKLMEFAASLPPRMKYQPGHLKTLTKRVLGKSFPEEFINRPKMGFGVPIGKWLRGPLQPLMRELLLGEPLRRRGLFNQAYIKSMIERHVSGREDSQYRLWTLMTFEAWARTFLDRADPLAAGPIDFTQIALRP
jgi:asparagine synthase (glutamine-hydrolysing)